MFSLRLSLILASLAAPTAALAQAPQPNAMRFEWMREGPAETCRDRCREWVSAAGQITATTASDFAVFARSRDLKGATIVLDSPGGHALVALDLGREFRRLGVTTTIGRTVNLPPSASGDQRATLSSRGRCASACTDVLLGGIRRNVPDEVQITVHQPWSNSKRADAEAATYAAREMVELARLAGQMGRYVAEMGVDMEFFEISMRRPPWEELRPLSKAELRRLRVHNFDGPIGTVAVGPTAPPTVSAPPLGAPPRLEAGWTLTDRDGKRVLARAHPLTIDGQEIGNFEIALFCGTAPGTMQIFYSEKRTSASGSPDRVAGVMIAVGREREALTVESSVAGKAPGEMVSTAKASVPASYLRALAEPARPPFIIATQTAARVRTQVRMGSAGLADNLVTLLGSCPR